jgi:hypothetical protein
VTKVSDAGEIKHYQPGATVEIWLTCKLDEGQFPLAFLIGPNSYEPEFQKQYRTKPTISPRREGDTFILEWAIPPTAEPGLYEVHHVDIMHSVTGMSGAQPLKAIPARDLPPFAFLVDPARVIKPADIPPITKIE